jgi:hypothetical protein
MEGKLVQGKDEVEITRDERRDTARYSMFDL